VTDTPHPPGSPAGKILGIGFHKTGTSSLGRALQVLGYRVAGPFGVRDPNIGQRALPEALARLDRHDAAQDNPWPVLFRELDEAVPGSRFVLTDRPDDQWLDSVVRHFGGSTTPMREWIYGVGDPIGHEEVFLGRYRAHRDAVRAHFVGRPGDLLVLRVNEGDPWAPLCDFLGVEVPSTPFPHANPGSWSRRTLNRVRARVRGAVGR